MCEINGFTAQAGTSILLDKISNTIILHKNNIVP
jgi:hypothetical protein